MNETLQWLAIIVLSAWTLIQYLWMTQASKVMHRHEEWIDRH